MSYKVILKKVWICANLNRISLRIDVMIANINRNTQKISLQVYSGKLDYAPHCQLNIIFNQKSLF